MEVQYGSNPLNAFSTPENIQYDTSFGTDTCADDVDNDQDGQVDDTGGMGRGPDPGCIAP